MFFILITIIVIFIFFPWIFKKIFLHLFRSYSNVREKQTDSRQNSRTGAYRRQDTTGKSTRGKKINVTKAVQKHFSKENSRYVDFTEEKEQ